MGLAARLRLARVYLVTDARIAQGDLSEFLGAAFAGGVDIVRIRQLDLSANAALEAIEIARLAAAPTQGLVCVDDSAELAGQCHADLLHLGHLGGASAPAREYLHQWALLGRSTHAADQVSAAVADRDVDYFCVGPVYTTSPNPAYPPLGLDPVRLAASVAPVNDVQAKPWFAIGGIDTTNLDEVIAAGARRICVSRAITRASEVEAVARELQTRLRAAWNADPTMERYVFQALAGGGPAR